MASSKPKSWREVKAKIIIRFGTISAAAAHLGCSAEAVRGAVKGTCPKVAKRLEALIP